MRLTVAQKLELVSETRRNNANCWSVAKANQLDYSVGKRYSLRVKKGLSIFERDGRPPKLNEESYNTIFEYMHSDHAWDRFKIRRWIRSEVTNTASQRYTNTRPPNSSLFISKSSVWVHCNKIVEGFVPGNIGDNLSVWSSF